MAPSGGAEGEKDPHQWSSNKKKRLASGDLVPNSDERNNSNLNQDPISTIGAMHGGSWKDSLIGEHAMQTDYNEEDFASDDDEKDGEEEPDCLKIYLTKKEKAELCRPWRQSLIIKVMGRGVGFMYLLNRIKSLWKPKAEIEMIALENDYFLVKFNSIMDYQYAAYKGPWMVLDHYLIVKEWCPNFDPFEVTEEKMLVWVRFPVLPIEYFKEAFLQKVGNKIGRFVRMDEATSITTKGKFARMCVEIDITKPLVPKFRIQKRTRRIEYEGIHLVCFHCGVYGHKKEVCPSFIVDLKAKRNQGNCNAEEEQVVAPVVQSASIEKSRLTEEPSKPYGPWMLVTRKPRRFDKSKGQSSVVEASQKSRDQKAGTTDGGAFDNLRDKENEETRNEHVDQDQVVTHMEEQGPSNGNSLVQGVVVLTFKYRKKK